MHIKEYIKMENKYEKQVFQIKKIPLQINEVISFFGWGSRIRTYEMSESESDALPLGDTPIYDILYNYKNMLSIKNELIKLILVIIFLGGRL